MAFSEMLLISTMQPYDSQWLYCYWRARFKDIHLYHKMDVALQKLDSIWNDLLEILAAFKEQYEALQDVLRNSLVLATADLQRTLQAFCESKRHVNTMVNNLHVIKEHLRKIQEKILNTPFLRHSKQLFSELQRQQKSVLVFVRFDSVGWL